MSNRNLFELREKYPNVALELDILSGRVSPDTGLVNSSYVGDEMQSYMELCVLEVIDTIYKQGHSGFSHGYMMSILIPLLKDFPVTPLTGNDWEWNKCIFSNGYQNKRCPKVFKDTIDGTAFNSNGRAFSDNGGKTYYTSKESHTPITFPCSWKDLETEYILKG